MIISIFAAAGTIATFAVQLGAYRSELQTSTKRLEQQAEEINHLEKEINAIRLNAAQSSGNFSPMQQQVIENLRAESARIEDRLSRTIIVMDSIYNLINEHLRITDEPRNPRNAPSLTPAPRQPLRGPKGGPSGLQRGEDQQLDLSR